MKRISGLQLSALVLLVASLVLGACSPAATPAPPPPTAVAQVAVPTQPPAPTQPMEPTQAPAPTTASTATVPTVAAATVAPSPAPTVAAAKPTATPWAITPGTLRLATTTSTADTGLLSWLLPQYEKATGVHVDVVAVGTGQAIAIGKAGDCDVLLVHARAQENAFVAAGDAKQRFDVMYNDFVIVGPTDDPAHVANAKNAVAAFQVIADSQSPFVSRGDGSGTQTKELSIWASAKITPTKSMSWYNSIGQGMGETLVFTNEKGGYTLSDRGTWLATASKLPNLKILLGGNSLAENKDSTLLNPYGIMAVNPDKHPGVQYDMAMKFLQWFISADTEKIIGTYGVDKYGQPLFYPSSDEYRATRSINVQSGTISQTLTLQDLQALPKTTLAGYEATGTKAGRLGKNTWGGASVKDVLLKVDPTLNDPRNSGKLITFTSSDGYVAVMKWVELFGHPAGGEALYDVKGCNECHGVNGEGSAPAGKTPAPKLAGQSLDIGAVSATLRTGGAVHAGALPYTTDQISDNELQQIVNWLNDPTATGTYKVDPASQITLLAYEKNSQPMNGSDGLLQLIVGMDQFAGRYSHWVKSIVVK